MIYLLKGNKNHKQYVHNLYILHNILFLFDILPQYIIIIILKEDDFNETV